MATNPHPTLTLDGWVSSSASRLDAMFADFLVAVYSQYPQGKIEASLPWLLVKHQDNYSALAADVKSVLTNYFSSKFSNTLVQCFADASTERSDWVTLRISAQVTDENNVVLELDEIRTVGNAKTIEFAKFNNGSLPYTEWMR